MCQNQLRPGYSRGRRRRARGSSSSSASSLAGLTLRVCHSPQQTIDDTLDRESSIILNTTAVCIRAYLVLYILFSESTAVYAAVVDDR